MKNLFFKKVKKFILLKDILNICKSSQSLNHNKKIFGVNNLVEASENQITFFNNLNYENRRRNVEHLHA